MKPAGNQHVIALTLVFLLGITACTALPGLPTAPAATAQPPTSQEISAGPTQGGTDGTMPEPGGEGDGNIEPITPVDDSLGDCLSDTALSMAAQIAGSFDDVTYEVVSGLHCEGFAFEDILLALETAELSEIEAAPRDLLWLRRDGMSWDEIWQALGLTD
jgi:hypothetical protein